ncbi:MAG: response regulator [Bacteroidota bacterium]
MVGRVLIVDDEDTLRLTIKTRLASAGFETEAAVDGEEAIEKLKSSVFDVVLLDINMPRMDGISALGIISEMYPKTDVIMLTGFADFTTAIECLKKGAKDYLVKPIDTTELITRMRSLLRARNSEAALGSLKKVQSSFLLDEILGSILLASDLVDAVKSDKSGKLSQDQGGMLNSLQKSLEEIISRAKEMVDPAQLGGKPSARASKPVQLSKVLGSVVKTMELTAKIAGVRLNLGDDAKGQKIEGDAAGLERAFRHIVTAALQVSVKGATIDLVESRSGAQAEVKFILSKTSEGVRKVIEQSLKQHDKLGQTAASLENAAVLLLAARQILEGHQGVMKIQQAKSGVTVHCELPVRQRTN